MNLATKYIMSLIGVMLRCHIKQITPRRGEKYSPLKKLEIVQKRMKKHLGVENIIYYIHSSES